MKERVWLDKKKGELFFNDTSLFAWRRDNAGRIQREFENIVGPATRVIFSEATRKIMREIFCRLAERNRGVRKKSPHVFVSRMLAEFPKYGYGVPELVMFDGRGHRARVMVKNCFNAIGYRRRSRPVCYRMEGILACLFETVFQRKVSCRETQCIAAGNRDCIFDVSAYNIPVKYSAGYPPGPRNLEPSDVEVRMSRGEIIHRGISSAFFPRGDAKNLEKESEKVIGRGAKGVYYMVARISTLDSIGKGILGSVRMKFISKFFKKKFIERLAGIAIERGYGILTYPLVDLGKKEIVVRVENCFNTIGAGKSDKPVCYTLSGIISAAGDIIFGRPMRCEEIRCRAMGDDFCEFHVHPET